MTKKTKITIDHQEIKKWVEKHQGQPAIIDAIEAGSDEVGIRVDFPGIKDEAWLAEAKPSEDTTWDVFFDIFEKKNLAFIYLDKKIIKNKIMAYKFINRDSLEEIKHLN